MSDTSTCLCPCLSLSLSSWPTSSIETEYAGFNWLFKACFKVSVRAVCSQPTGHTALVHVYLIEMYNLGDLHVRRNKTAWISVGWVAL